MVKATMKIASEASMRMMPHSRARGSRENGLWRIERPTGPGRSAGHEEACHQHQHGEQVDPVAQHVHERENHVARAEHQRDQVIAEPAEEQRGEQVDHHDHAVHGDELVVGPGVMKESVPGNPSCIGISPTTPARPARPIAVIAYWTAMTLWSWLQTYLPTHVLGW